MKKPCALKQHPHEGAFRIKGAIHIEETLRVEGAKARGTGNTLHLKRSPASNSFLLWQTQASAARG